jgi:hypothetical protein
MATTSRQHLSAGQQIVRTKKQAWTLSEQIIASRPALQAGRGGAREAAAAPRP